LFGQGVYARRFDASGTAITGDVLVNQTIVDDQQWARVASDADGNFVVTWTSSNQDGTPQSVYARQFSANGTQQGGEFRVNDTATGTQKNSTIAMNATGEFVITWQGNGPGDTDGIFYRRFDANGTALNATDQLANVIDRGSEIDPAATMDDAGNFVIFWREPGNSIYFQRFDSSGNIQGGDVEVDHGLSDSWIPSVASDAAGNFTVVYRVDGLGSGVWGKGYLADGSQNYSWFQIDSGDSDSPTISMAADGSFIVTYEKTGDGDLKGVYARKYDSSGSALGSEFLVNTTTSGNQHLSSVDVIDLENFVVVWSGEGPGDGDGVFARQFGTFNSPPTFTAFSNPIDTTNEDVQVEITFAELAAQGDQADSDGTVQAFVVKAVTSGILKIGADSATATAWVAGSNDTIDSSNHAYWIPDLDANGILNAFEVVAQDDQGLESTGNVTAQVDVTGLALWLSTTGTTNDNNSPVVNWDKQDVMSFAGPAPTFGENSTSGVFSSEYSLQEDIRAMHFVSTPTTVETGGGVPYDLQIGQVVLSFRNAVSLPSTSGNINVDNRDVVVYTPSTGKYELLLDDTIGANIHAITIVEKQVTIGLDTVLNAGTYLIAHSGGSLHDNIYTYVGTNGAETPQLLLDGESAQFGLTGSDQIQGLELIEDAVTLGSTNLAKGTLLITTNNTATLNGGATGNPEDMFSLTVNRTLQDSIPDSIVSASILFDGDDVGLSGANEALNAISLINSVTANATPTTTGISNVTVNEDAADTVIDLFAAFADAEDADANLTYTVQNNTNAGLFTSTLIDGVAGTLTLDYAADQNGGANITVRATDTGGLIVETTFTVTVNAVNDAPSFTTLGNQTVPENGGAQTVAGFATPAAGGGTDESGQTFSYTVSNDNPGLFSMAPSIDASGQLTYTLAAGQSGTATVTVSVTDSGGTANSGVETSPNQTFDINVTANATPTTTGISNVTVNEDAADTVIDLFAAFADAEDADANLTYTVQNNTNAGLFTSTLIDGVAGTLTLDYAADQNGSANITVRATDTGGLFVETTFTVTVNAVNDAPIDIALSNSTVSENIDTNPGLNVGKLSSVDPDIGDSAAYTIVGGTD